MREQINEQRDSEQKKIGPTRDKETKDRKDTKRPHVQKGRKGEYRRTPIPGEGPFGKGPGVGSGRS